MLKAHKVFRALLTISIFIVIFSPSKYALSTYYEPDTRMHCWIRTLPVWRRFVFYKLSAQRSRKAIFSQSSLWNQKEKRSSWGLTWVHTMGFKEKREWPQNTFRKQMTFPTQDVGWCFQGKWSHQVKSGSWWRGAVHLWSWGRFPDFHKLRSSVAFEHFSPSF